MQRMWGYAAGEYALSMWCIYNAWQLTGKSQIPRRTQVPPRRCREAPVARWRHPGASRLRQAEGVPGGRRAAWLLHATCRSTTFRTRLSTTTPTPKDPLAKDVADEGRAGVLAPRRRGDTLQSVEMLRLLAGRGRRPTTGVSSAARSSTYETIVRRNRSPNGPLTRRSGWISRTSLWSGTAGR